MYINIQLMHLGTVREVVVQNSDGGHTIFIDDQLAPAAQREAYRHALQHILCDDFGSGESANVIEAKRHKKPGAGTPGCRKKMFGETK